MAGAGGRDGGKHSGGVLSLGRWWAGMVGRHIQFVAVCSSWLGLHSMYSRRLWGQRLSLASTGTATCMHPAAEYSSRQGSRPAYKVCSSQVGSVGIMLASVSL